MAETDRIPIHTVLKPLQNGQILKMCEFRELVNISQLFCWFSQTRHLTVELSRPKPKLDWKTWKMTRQFRLEKRGQKVEIFGKILQCGVDPCMWHIQTLIKVMECLYHKTSLLSWHRCLSLEEDAAFVDKMSNCYERVFFLGSQERNDSLEFWHYLSNGQSIKCTNEWENFVRRGTIEGALASSTSSAAHE